MRHTILKSLTLGAGQGVVVFYGMAKPVRKPQIGPAQPAK
jgi:hypothetical protein